MTLLNIGLRRLTLAMSQDHTSGTDWGNARERFGAIGNQVWGGGGVGDVCPSGLFERPTTLCTLPIRVSPPRPPFPLHLGRPTHAHTPLRLRLRLHPGVRPIADATPFVARTSARSKPTASPYYSTVYHSSISVGNTRPMLHGIRQRQCTPPATATNHIHPSEAPSRIRCRRHGEERGTRAHFIPVRPIMYCTLVFVPTGPARPLSSSLGPKSGRRRGPPLRSMTGTHGLPNGTKQSQCNPNHYQRTSPSPPAARRQWQLSFWLTPRVALTPLFSLCWPKYRGSKTSLVLLGVSENRRDGISRTLSDRIRP